MIIGYTFDTNLGELSWRHEVDYGPDDVAEHLHGKGRPTPEYVKAIRAAWDYIDGAIEEDPWFAEFLAVKYEDEAREAFMDATEGVTWAEAQL